MVGNKAEIIDHNISFGPKPFDNNQHGFSLPVGTPVYSLFFGAQFAPWTQLKGDLAIFKFQPLTLDTFDLYNRMTRDMYLESSDFSFVNLFIWRHAAQTQYTVDSGFFIPYCNYKGDRFFLTPVGGPLEYFAALCAKLNAYARSRGHAFKMRTVPKEYVCRLLKDAPGRYKIMPDRNNWDYLYRTRDLLLLKGRKYQQKRNQINKFQKLFRYQYQPLLPPLSEAQITACLDLFDRWAEEKKHLPTLAAEKVALQEALAHMEALGLKGGALIVEGKLEAFSIGSLLHKEIALIHFEKANPELPGIYPVMNRLFLAHAWKDTVYVNRENDMGLPGLRQAKRRYHPLRMVKKYIVLANPEETP